MLKKKRSFLCRRGEDVLCNLFADRFMIVTAWLMWLCACKKLIMTIPRNASVIAY